MSDADDEGDRDEREGHEEQLKDSEGRPVYGTVGGERNQVYGGRESSHASRASGIGASLADKSPTHKLQHRAQEDLDLAGGDSSAEEHLELVSNANDSEDQEHEGENEDPDVEVEGEAEADQEHDDPDLNEEGDPSDMFDTDSSEEGDDEAEALADLPGDIGELAGGR
jgi:hypothetical protein